MTPGYGPRWDPAQQTPEPHGHRSNEGKTVTEKSGIVRTVALLGRKEGMTFQEFDDYWRKVHAPLAARVPGVVRYIQRHVVPDPATGEPDNGFGIDGLAVLDYESVEAMEAGWATKYGQRALDDVPNFLGKHYVLTLEDVAVVGGDYY
ncbi:conserved hypothetical protein [Parafrankia sp. Ea1.12]|nr:conserved hypothetical protein [Parafrankia sp. Ea1.12]